VAEAEISFVSGLLLGGDALGFSLRKEIFFKA
jgi:hypothetical protein